MKRTGFGLLICGCFWLFCFGIVNTTSAAEKIKWGATLDMSGPTSDMASQVAWGFIDCLRFANTRGGVNGKEVILEVVDHKYDVKLGVATYERFKQDKDILGIFMQGTGIAFALLPKNNKDKFVVIGTNLDAPMTVGTKYPYNFCLGPTYSDLARTAIKYMVDNSVSDKPKICFVRPKGRYGDSPVKAIKMYAEDLGIEPPQAIVVPWGSLDTTSQVLVMKKIKPEFVYITLTAMNAAVVLKDAMRYGFKSQFIADVRTISEHMSYYAQDAAEGYMGLSQYATFNTPVPGIEDVKEAAMKYRKAKYLTKQLIFPYVEGYCYGLTVLEALKRADDKGNLTRVGVKEALETLDNFQLGGLYPGVTFTKADHRGSILSKMYQIKNKEMVPITGWLSPSDDPKYIGK